MTMLTQYKTWTRKKNKIISKTKIFQHSSSNLFNQKLLPSIFILFEIKQNTKKAINNREIRISFECDFQFHIDFRKKLCGLNETDTVRHQYVK